MIDNDFILVPREMVQDLTSYDEAVRLKAEQKALALLADPVPPVGGGRLPERFTNQTPFDGSERGFDVGWNSACEAWEPHVTRLQAEAERLTAQKADADIPASPADKGQGEPVDVEADMLQAFSDHAKQFTFRNHPATPGMFPKGFPWFKAGYELGRAEQPAPVAVVMPERKTVKAGLLSESNTHNQGWNACLDELALLNPIKQESTKEEFDKGAALESLAKQIYESWQSQPGYLPWVNGGNSLKQDEARRIASRTFELALANQIEE